MDLDLLFQNLQEVGLNGILVAFCIVFLLLFLVILLEQKF